MNVLTPDLGVEKAELSEWLVQVGDRVSAGQSLLLAESSKASVEVPSPAAGTIQALLLPQGASIKEGVPLLVLEPDPPPAPEAHPSASTDITPDAPAAVPPVEKPVDKSVEKPADPPVATETVRVPDLGVEKAELSEWLVQVGDTVTAGQSLLLAESSKASVEVPSPVSGTVTALHVQAGQTIHPGDALLDVHTSAPPPAPARTPAAPAAPSPDRPAAPVPPSVQTQSAPVAPPSDPASPTVYAGPAVRKLARQMGIALGEVQPSLPTGRLLKEDLYQHVKRQMDAAQTARPPAAGPAEPPVSGLPPLPDFGRWGGGEPQTLSRLQQAAIVHLAKNQFIPQVTQFDQADITELEALRQSLKDDYKKDGTSLTLLAFIARVLAHLLREEPRFNSHLQDGQTLLLRHEVHLGIAVATDDGLIVPVLRNPDQKGIAQIARELQELSQKARARRLSPADLAGATMTITSLGALGGTAFTPLVSWPEVAILGISPAALQPVWNGQEFRPRLLLPLSLSYDHRVINGADAARFTRRLGELLGDLRRVLL